MPIINVLHCSVQCDHQNFEPLLFYPFQRLFRVSCSCCYKSLLEYGILVNNWKCQRRDVNLDKDFWLGSNFLTLEVLYCYLANLIVSNV